MEINPRLGSDKVFSQIMLYLIGAVVGVLLQFFDIFHVGRNAPNYIFLSLLFIPPIALLFFNSLKTKVIAFLLISVALMTVFQAGHSGVSFYESKPKIEYNKYLGRYVFDNGTDCKGEIIILHDGSFRYEAKSYLEATLNFGTGHLEGNQLVFDGNNSDVQFTGMVSGDVIKVNAWTSLYGDTYKTYYKTDKY